MSKKPTSGARRSSTPSLKLYEFEAVSPADAIAAAGARGNANRARVPLDQLHVIPGFNIRITDTADYEAGLVDLRDSILLEGYYETKPLSVFACSLDGKPVIAIIDGHRRFAAAQMAVEEGAEIPDLPVIFKSPKQTDLDLAAALMKENSGVQPTFLEKAVLAERFLRAKETEEAVAERFQVSVRTINDMKTLLSGPKEVRELVKSGKVSATEAIAQLRKDPSGAKLLEAVEKAAQRAAEKEAGGGGERTRITRQTIEDGPVAATVKMVTHRGNFQVKAGAEFSFEDAAPYLSIIGDETWFKKARKQTQRIALEDVSVEVKVRRPAKPAEGEDAAAETKAETPAAETRKAPAKAAVPVKGNGARKNGRAAATGEDLGLDDSADVPNLKELGIAEPADAGL